MDLNLSFVESPELCLVVIRAENAPGGIRAAFARLESRVGPLRGRKLYGVSHGGHAAEYYAGVVPQDEEEGERLGLPLLTIPGGTWAKASLFQWEDRLEDIAPLVDQMIESIDFDPSRPVLEYHRSSLELHLLVPVGPA